MIPILYIFTFITAMFCVFCAGRLYLAYRARENEYVNNFLRAFVCLVFYFLLVSLPGLIFKNPVLVQQIYALSYVFAFLAAIFLLKAALKMFGLTQVNFFIYFALLAIFLTTGLNLAIAQPASMAISNNQLFYHWEEGTPLFIMAINGVIGVVLAAVCSFFFFAGGLKMREKRFKKRAFLIAAGLSVLSLAGLLSFILARQLKDWWLVLTIGRLFAFLGVLLMFIGIYYCQD